MGKNSILEFTQVPIGTILPFALKDEYIPEGWLKCDGRYILDKHVTLRNALGDVKTPNLVCRTLVGSGTVDVDFEQSDKTKANFDKNDTNWLLGRTGGEYKHQLTVAEMPSHSHTINKGNFGFHFLNFIGDRLYAKIDIDLLKNDIPLYGTDSEGNDKGHNTMQPYYVIHYIIYAGSE